MSGRNNFQKLIKIKESEKNQILSDYQTSVSEFEDVAEQLYSFMKKKEDLESTQQQKLKQGLSIYEMRHQQSFISNLEQTIAYYQKLVIKARNKMQFVQDKLLEKNIEVKKYEKIYDNSQKAYLESIHLFESKFMDEISIQQYINRGN
ncbi:flagellar export protein FliJ [Bacillus sp. PS06]|uniref:flagellar export protein FliJ n=1 Tax=Bacillus sp. PS06 TaxID=2764176 RepID=UPI0017816B89|nr:flagellar export protein FliJ [Bacillus sp. PS06]MBD8068298.1 flagellar biosynthesis chaperone FliJ [Bacillus sp. PS06]